MTQRIDEAASFQNRGKKKRVPVHRHGSGRSARPRHLCQQRTVSSCLPIVLTRQGYPSLEANLALSISARRLSASVSGSPPWCLLASYGLARRSLPSARSRAGRPIIYRRTRALRECRQPLMFSRLGEAGSDHDYRSGLRHCPCLRLLAQRYSEHCWAETWVRHRNRGEIEFRFKSTSAP